MKKHEIEENITISVYDFYMQNREYPNVLIMHIRDMFTLFDMIPDNISPASAEYRGMSIAYTDNNDFLGKICVSFCQTL